MRRIKWMSSLIGATIVSTYMVCHATPLSEGPRAQGVVPRKSERFASKKARAAISALFASKNPKGLKLVFTCIGRDNVSDEAGPAGDDLFGTLWIARELPE